MKPRALLLTLAPLLGATDLVIKALVIGVLGLLLPLLTGLLLAPLRQQLQGRSRALAGLFIGAWLASSAELLLRMLSPELTDALGPYLPMLALPCLTVALENAGDRWTGARSGLAFLVLALLLGALRETLGHGSLFAHAGWLFGVGLDGWRWSAGAPLLTQTAGAFILLGLLLALHRYFNRDDR